MTEDYDANKPEEAVSDAPDMEADDDIEYGEKEAMENETCPDCGSHEIMKYNQMTSPDDYETVWECADCGTTQIA